MTKIKSMSLPDGLLARYKCGDTFIETGTGGGGGIQAALDAGFRTVASIDTDEEKYLAARRNFPNRYFGHKVLPMWGNSPQVLAQLIPLTNTFGRGCTIFLDAHHKDHPSPLRAELDQILKLTVPHVLIIDDLHRYRDGTWLPSWGDIMDILIPHYWLRELPNSVAPDNLLIGTTRQQMTLEEFYAL